MSTRVATHNDTQKIVDFLQKYHEDGSNLSDIPFDRGTMSKAVDYYIGMPKHVVFVYESGGAITGCLAGSVEPFMFNEKRKWATDLFNIADKGGVWLLKRFIEWAKMHKVDRVFMGVSTGNQRSEGLYEAVGLDRVGGFYVKKFSED